MANLPICNAERDQDKGQHTALLHPAVVPSCCSLGLQPISTRRLLPLNNKHRMAGTPQSPLPFACVQQKQLYLSQHYPAIHLNTREMIKGPLLFSQWLWQRIGSYPIQFFLAISFPQHPVNSFFGGRRHLKRKHMHKRIVYKCPYADTPSLLFTVSCNSKRSKYQLLYFHG